jgi:hypothetical protein
MAFTVTTILAPTGATIPIVFVADGFKSSQISTFPDRMSICIVGNGDDMTDVAIHEFGHSFGDLDDEYLDSVYAANAPTYEPDVWYYGNRLNVRDANPGGWYQGARYVTTKYRATDDDLMKNIYASGFGSPNEALLQDRIDDEA